MNVAVRMTLNRERKESEVFRQLDLFREERYSPIFTIVIVHTVIVYTGVSCCIQMLARCQSEEYCCRNKMEWKTHDFHFLSLVESSNEMGGS